MRCGLRSPRPITRSSIQLHALDMAKNGKSQVVIRISQPLQDEITAVAAEEGRTLAGYVRRVLVDIAAARMIERNHDGAIQT